MEYKLKQQQTTFSLEKLVILIMVLFFGFTSLRFGRFGIGEVILLLLCIGQFIKSRVNVIRISEHAFTIFWIVYLYIITIGFVVNNLLDIAPQSVLFDYTSYIVILFLCLTFETKFNEMRSIDLYSLLKIVYWGGLLVIGFLYLLYLMGIDNIAGHYLTYDGADIFSPFASDYHQFAYFIAPLPFVALYIIQRETDNIVKFITAVSIILLISMGLSTSSNTLVSSWVNTTILIIALLLWRKLRRQYRSASIIAFFICLAFIGLLFSFDIIAGIVKDFFEESSNGEHRILLWINSLKVWLYSPIVGLGPGSFSGNEIFQGTEAHNTFLQVLTQGGILGGILYALLIFRLIRITRVNIFILCAVFTLIMYGLGINDLRRTVLWFYFVLFYFLCMKGKEEEK
ncbi:MAG TPA: O-antigen ligase domain-containing protein [Bacillus bacterium]|uniref:Polysaccharide polymerase n=1 Tax=Siminovitchia fordii TaxID=254759 RepID=A0ABQ4K5E1_9BACI|nr:O-antigen ligase family protein [Siminovitchia fordii]GIN20944.1 polysaccharide polymerase [Siminovitchia fordii]HBZ12109.1 O-antigen ligase domain-containing protein [Bacillus sp. (in: firmicutes)]